MKDQTIGTTFKIRVAVNYSMKPVTIALCVECLICSNKKKISQTDVLFKFIRPVVAYIYNTPSSLLTFL